MATLAAMAAVAVACGNTEVAGPESQLPLPQAAGSVQGLLSAGQRLGFASAYDSRGTFYLHKGEYEFAVRDFTAAVGLVDDLPKLHTNRALALVLLGLDEDARADLEAAAELGARPALTLAGIRVFSCDNPTSRREEDYRTRVLGFVSAVHITGMRFCPDEIVPLEVRWSK